LPEGLKVRITQFTALEGDGLSKAQHGVGLGVSGSRSARGADLVVVKAQLPGESAMGGEAIPGAVDLSNSQG
jgi:hypothetical protein